MSALLLASTSVAQDADVDATQAPPAPPVLVPETGGIVEPPAALPPAALPPAAPPLPPAPLPPVAAVESAPSALPTTAPIEEKPDWPVLGFHARLMSGFAVEREHPAGGQPARDETQPGFFLKQARVGVGADLSKRVSAAVSFDLDGAVLRNAYLNLRLSKAVQLRSGNFKRPFTRLANRSVGAIPFRSRGRFDKLILEDQAWGDRALGAMVWGRPVKALRYYAAVMSPAAIGSHLEGANVIGRVELSPVKALSLGVAAAHKWTERFTDGPNLSMHGVAGDVKVEAGALYAAVEVNAAQNPNPPPVASSTADRTPWAVGALGYATYDFKLGKKLTLGPVGVLEWMDTDTDYAHDERVRGVVGLVLGYRDKLVRVMPQVEINRPIGGASSRGEVASESYYLLLATEI